MLLLGRKEYARQAKYGYVRGREPVNYVSNIRSRFKAYTEMSGTGGTQATRSRLQTAALTPGPLSIR
jgi:membrane-bound lytic murein transglycosylase MltF